MIKESFVGFRNKSIFLFLLLITTVFLQPNGKLNYLATTLNFVAVLVSLVLFNTDLRKMFASKSTTIFFLTYLSYPLLSVMWIKSRPFYDTQLTYIILHVLIFYISCYYFLELKRASKYYIKIIPYIAILFLAVCFWELLTANHLPISKYYGTPLPIPTGFYLGENHQAFAFSMIFPIICYYYVKEKSYLLKVLYMAILTGIMVVIFILGARISILVLLPVFIYVLVKHSSLKIYSTMLIALMLTTFYLSRYKATEFELFKKLSINQFASINSDITSYSLKSTQIRINMAKNAFNMFNDSDFIGVGAGNYDYFSKQGFYAEIGWIENAHSYLFELLANYGLFVLIPFLIFIGVMAWKLFALIKLTSGDFQLLARYNLLTLILFIPLSFLPSSMFSMLLVWIHLAYIYSFIYKGTAKINE
ncbi:MAG: hypothetical protein B6226_01730 [Candidatus Cloacimonetes bacterium 4572_65]|nr:MAG: hypothetical protein B6226_01730 [Candidatus Cloacimonetes bacterium 4572_65]